jgi:hypothetical protein
LERFEEWLLSRNWGKEPKKKVIHTHILGSSNLVKLENWLSSEKVAINVPGNVNYEIIDQICPIKVNKAISYLR